MTHAVTSVGDMVDIDIGKDTDMDMDIGLDIDLDKAGNYSTVADND